MTTACEHCLRRALLRSQSLRVAESMFTSRGEAAGLLRLDDSELVERLARVAPEAYRAIDAELKALLGRSARCWSLCTHDAGFPAGMRELADCPPVLFGIGDASLLAEADEAVVPRVAIVGARRASGYGRDVAYGIASDAVAAGFQVVSGMALGIDGAAHRGALRGGGRTIAVLAGGPDDAYPRSHRLLHEQIAESGAVISENPPGVAARRWAFAARNRIIAALAPVTVFVEGAPDSGARHTIEFALDLGRNVGAVPGPVSSPMSTGPHKYLREGAILIRDFSDVLESLALEAPRQLSIDSEMALGADAQAVLEQVRVGATNPRAIARELPQLDVRDVVRALGELELAGIVKRDGRGEYSPANR